MKIFVVGFPKTGTKSLDKALEILGYKVSGFGRSSTEIAEDWIRYMEGKGTLEDLKKIYEAYDVASGSPTFHYWTDFLKAFPDIKFIHVLRDEDIWLESWKREIIAENSNPVSFPLAYFSSSARRLYRFGQTEAFPKTGTKSLDKAMEILGYKVSGFGRSSTEIAEDWIRYMEGKGTLEDLKKMYEGYDVASATPTFHYWKDFLKAFPDIKLIHMLRDENTWVASWQRDIVAENSSPVSFPLAYFSPSARRLYRFYQTVERTFYNSPPQRFNKCSVGITDENWKKYFREHNERIRKEAAKDKMLIFNLKDGWKPLCEFLNKDIPDGIPFPHVNKGNNLFKEFLKKDSYYAIMYKEMYITIAMMVAGFSVVFLLCAQYLSLLK